MIYLDANATTPLHPRVRAAMEPLLGDVFANPSSLHPPGQAARALIEQARRQVASFLGCRPPEVVFTSGGTEANALALEGVLRGAREGRCKLVTTAGEHPSVSDTARHLAQSGCAELEVIGLSGSGIFDEERALAAIDERTVLASIQAANNVVGTLQPLARIAARCREVGALLHVDAVQLPGKAPCRVAELGADLLSISAHKMHGPKGVGALYVRKGVVLAPLFHGGGQEGRLRPGTENAPGIVGLGAACELALTELEAHAPTVAALRDRLERGILEQVPSARAVAADSPRVANTTAILFPGQDGAALMVALGAAGIACALGSACSSGDVKPSSVFLAMGISHRDAKSILRFSLSSLTTDDEIDETLQILPATMARMQRLGR